MPSCAVTFITEKMKRKKNKTDTFWPVSLQGIIDTIDKKNVDKNPKSGAKISHAVNKTLTG